MLKLFAVDEISVSFGVSLLPPATTIVSINSSPYLTSMAGPAALVVPALKKHTATVIWAHGLGDRSVV